MTETEWLESFEPAKMLAAVSGRVAEDRYWAFVAAAVGRVPHEVMSDDLVRMVGPAPGPAAGPSGVENLRHAFQGVPGEFLAWNAAGLCDRVTNDRYKARERAALANTVRDVFGNPFRPAAFPDAWRTSTAVGLAEGIDEGGAYDRLPILADALQDAGCEDEGVREHCRGDGPHARGCWVVDGVLGRG